MSETKMTSYDQANDFINNQIFAPVFFEKLAQDYGISPMSEEEAYGFLSLAGRLDYLYAQEQTKQASARTELVNRAQQGLDKLLGQGRFAGALPTIQDQEVKEAAAQLVLNPYVRDAALLYQDGMRQAADR